MIACVSEGVVSSLPQPFIDTTGMTVNYNNYGVVVISFSIITTIVAGPPGGGRVSFSLNGIDFIGYVIGISPIPIDGTDYMDSKVVVQGYAC